MSMLETQTFRLLPAIPISVLIRRQPDKMNLWLSVTRMGHMQGPSLSFPINTKHSFILRMPTIKIYRQVIITEIGKNMTLSYKLMEDFASSAAQIIII
jgi:hypothetical protein